MLITQIYFNMKTTLNYKFKRKSKNHLDWLINIIKSERYYLIEASIVGTNKASQYRV